MASTSKIEWTDASWNPIRARSFRYGKLAKPAIGWHCEYVSEGCRGCYAETMNQHLGTGIAYKPGARDGIDLFLDEKVLLAPLSWRKPRMILVCSMTDLFGEWVEDEWIDRMFAAMALCPRHKFQVLTKRPRRMRKWADRPRPGGAADFIAARMEEVRPAVGATWVFQWPLPNVWLGVSCEDQNTADARIPDLLATPAAVRFLSCEPMLAPIDLRALFKFCPVHDHEGGRLDWVICGGEHGHHARPMHPQWARSLRDQCAAALVPFLFKQWGEWAPLVRGNLGNLGAHIRHGRMRIVHPSGRSDVEVAQATGGHGTEHGSRYMARVGKKRAGRLLDGIEHNGMPKP